MYSIGDVNSNTISWKLVDERIHSTPSLNASLTLFPITRIEDILRQDPRDWKVLEEGWLD